MDKVICKACGESYDPATFEYGDEIEDGVCMSCRVNKSIEEWDEKVKKELVEFNKKFGTEYDGEAIFYACGSGAIPREQLIGFPAFLEYWDYGKWIRERQTLIQKNISQ